MAGNVWRLFTAVVVVATALAASVAATAAPAGQSFVLQQGVERSSLAQMLPLPTGITRTLSARPSRRVQREVLQAASSLTATALPPTELPGFAYCDDDFAKVWPAFAPLHDVTVTRNHFIFSQSGDFTDATVSSVGWYFLQLGSTYYTLNIDPLEVYGPWTYVETWTRLNMGSGSTTYVAFVNEVFYIDDGVRSPSSFELLQTAGNTPDSPYVCQP
jgi:hypothetical protein